MTEIKKLLTAEEIFAAQDLKTVDVDMPEWGGTVRLRMLAAGEAALFTDDNKKDSSTRMVLLCAVKDDGSRLFTQDSLDKLQAKSLQAIQRLQNEAIKLNGLNKEGLEATKNA